MTPQDISQVHTVVTESCATGGDQWLLAIAGISGTLLGTIASFIPNLIVESRRLRKESDLVEASLISEMTALMEIAEERRYLPSLSDAIEHLEKSPKGSTYSFQAQIPPHYSRVYQANSHRIGIIEKSKATDIIRFHQLVDAVVQDVIPGGVLHGGASIEAFREAHQILSRAFEIGRKYANRT